MAIRYGCSGSVYPKVAAISRRVDDQIRAVTWAETAIVAKAEPEVVWKKWMHLSLDPPPVATSPSRQGQKAMALTAALCIQRCFSAPGPSLRMPVNDGFAGRTAAVSS